MFYSTDKDSKGYLTRVHLAEVIRMLGPAPKTYQSVGYGAMNFSLKTVSIILLAVQHMALKETPNWLATKRVETRSENTRREPRRKEREDVLNFMRKMLQ